MRKAIFASGVLLTLCALGLSPAWAGHRDDYSYENSRLDNLAYKLKVEAIDLEKTTKRQLRHRDRFSFGRRGYGRHLVYKLNRLSDAARDYYYAVEHYGPNRYKTRDAFYELKYAFENVADTRFMQRNRRIQYDLRQVEKLLYRTKRFYKSRKVIYRGDYGRRGDYGKRGQYGKRGDYDDRGKYDKPRKYGKRRKY